MKNFVKKIHVMSADLLTLLNTEDKSHLHEA